MKVGVLLELLCRLLISCWKMHGIFVACLHGFIELVMAVEKAVLQL